MATTSTTTMPYSMRQTSRQSMFYLYCTTVSYYSHLAFFVNMGWCDSRGVDSQLGGNKEVVPIERTFA